MKKEDILEEIIDIGKNRGKLTYDEINAAVPSERFPPEDIEELVDLLYDMGIEVVDVEEPHTSYEEISPPEEEEVPEKTEDIVQTYFHSMGNISILKRNEEVLLAKSLEEGKDIIKE